MPNQPYNSASVHCHSTYCDGKNSLAEMASAAVAQGITTLGFSGHSLTFEDTPYGMSALEFARYSADIKALQTQYVGKLDILYGMEWDYYSTALHDATEDDTDPNLVHAPNIDLDYWVGSVHCLRHPHTGVYYTIDWHDAMLQRCIDEGFDGDGLAAAEAYFATIAKMASFRPTILGHFDIIKKLNTNGKFFDENHPRYLAAALSALSAAKQYGCVLEVNTGGVYRGYRTDFYPSDRLLAAWQKMGGQVTITADAHSTDSLLFGYDEAAETIRAAGFQQVLVLKKDGFVASPL
ncbi:MAG: histidinol-phosphatase HisJ family protein [Faecalibacterium sp.]